MLVDQFQQIDKVQFVDTGSIGCFPDLFSEIAIHRCPDSVVRPVLEKSSLGGQPILRTIFLALIAESSISDA